MVMRASPIVRQHSNIFLSIVTLTYATDYKMTALRICFWFRFVGNVEVASSVVYTDCSQSLRKV